MLNSSTVLFQATVVAPKEAKMLKSPFTTSSITTGIETSWPMYPKIKSVPPRAIFRNAPSLPFLEPEASITKS
ncbi:unannotated protein [freshwater metagenome]|uniref:Unannotated protein n=1 Tax=freshwater metagenome TaxID=449393 RepID=A0A6J6MD70_9ZZZZ